VVEKGGDMILRFFGHHFMLQLHIYVIYQFGRESRLFWFLWSLDFDQSFICIRSVLMRFRGTDHSKLISGRVVRGNGWGGSELIITFSLRLSAECNGTEYVYIYIYIYINFSLSISYIY